jgi:large subunit ribosomal protein L25
VPGTRLQVGTKRVLRLPDELNRFRHFLSLDPVSSRVAGGGVLSFFRTSCIYIGIVRGISFLTLRGLAGFINMNMEALKLEATSRQIKGKQVKTLRSAGTVPAVVYGHGIPSRDISLDFRAFEKLARQAGESSLVDLSIDGAEPVKVLVHEIQYHPLKDTIIHADLRQVRMDEKLEANVAVKFVGEAPAVKAFGALLVRNLDAISVRCLPKDLVHEIEVDLSTLKNFEDRISVGDITAPAGIEFLNGNEEVIVIAAQPISEEELASLDTKPEAAVTDVKVATEEKKAERDAAKAAEDEAKK